MHKNKIIFKFSVIVQEQRWKQRSNSATVEFIVDKENLKISEVKSKKRCCKKKNIVYDFRDYTV